MFLLFSATNIKKIRFSLSQVIFQALFLFQGGSEQRSCQHQALLVTSA